MLRDPLLGEIANQHGVSTAAVALQWNIQRGVTVIPASLKRSELAENLALLPRGEWLSEPEMAAIAGLDRGRAGRTLILEWGESSPGELLAPTPTGSGSRL